uniref:Zinc finger protein 271-like n=1 Tax=Gouania willdenowi TaxID=441366 RepID=A0A8C5EGT8_GOUWI
MATSSVYMCFPCYQEFDTLEEVLKHQLTCTAEDEQPDTSGGTIAVPQNEAQATPVEGETNETSETTNELSDQPRILYQCGDCDELFKSLVLWQQHRKKGTCQQSESVSAEPDPPTEPEVTAKDAPSPSMPDEKIENCKTEHRQQGEEKAAVVPEGAVEEVPGASEQEQEASAAATSVSFTQPEMFFCVKCGQSFSDGDELVAHRNQKHGLKDPLHICSHCGDGFMNTTQYLYHWRVHRSTAVMGVADGPQTCEEIVSCKPEDSSQDAKRLRSPSASVEKKDTGSKDELEGSTAADSDNTNQPPPAKLLQDWARTPLPHVCPYCGKTFTRRVFLRAHVYSHTGEKLFTCKVCTKSFSNSQSLLRHSMSHTGNKPFSCEYCGKNFSQAATLKRHQLIHTSTQPRRKRGRKPVPSTHGFSCPKCPSQFITEEQLNDHKLLHTSHPFPCSVCGEAFKRRKDLDLHSLIHQDKQPATCPHCVSQFVNQSVLEIHMQRCPTTEEEKNTGRGRGQGRGRCVGQVECDLCGHRCMTQEGLDLHRLSHTGQTPLKCPVRPCRRRFTSNSALEEHVVAHFQGKYSKSKSRPRFRCQICHKEFAYNSTFNVHMRTHTDERPFECATCGKRFRQLPHLQDHERIHSGLRPFCCWICGRSFSVAARLTEHARTHSGEKPYPCPHCNTAFRSRSNLDKHIRLHGDVPSEPTEQVVQVADAAEVEKMLQEATVLSSLAASAEGEAGTVQTIYVLQGAEGETETVMIPSDQLSGLEGASQVVILPSSALGGQGIPTITMDGNEITMVQASHPQHHSIEYVVEETI